MIGPSTTEFLAADTQVRSRDQLHLVAGSSRSGELHLVAGPLAAGVNWQKETCSLGRKRGRAIAASQFEILGL